MKFIQKFLLSFLLLFVIYSCEKENKIEEPQIFKRDYASQYANDISKIEDFLKTHSVIVVDHAGFPDDQNATFVSVPNLDATSMWGSNAITPKSSLLFKLSNIGGVSHKIYYIKFRNGIGVSPTVNNQIKAYYKGFLLTDDTIPFDFSPETGTTLYLNQTIFGWREILPEFKMGTITGTDQYADFGAGVMFLPSALAYYEKSYTNKIPAYSPIIFTVKLFSVI